MLIALGSLCAATSQARAGPTATPVSLANQATSGHAIRPGAGTGPPWTSSRRFRAASTSTETHEPSETRHGSRSRFTSPPAAGAAAEDQERPHKQAVSPPKAHGVRMALEALAVTGGGAVWYWARTDLQRQDWELSWDWDSWKYKLTDPGSLRFDTNGFNYNAIDHPMAGTADYQIARANGLGAGGATLFAFGAGLLWEYAVEFKELPSINDIIVNGGAGVAVGEPLRQVGLLALSRPPGLVSTAVAAATAPFDLIHGHLDGGAFRGGPEPWHRVELSLDGVSAWPGDRGGVATRRLEAALGIDVELVRVPGFGRAGRARGSAGVGAWNRIIARLAYGAGEEDPMDLGARLLTRTAIWGRDWRATGRARGGLHGQEGLLSLGTGFTYETRQLVEERDRLAALHLLGGQLLWALYRGPLRLSWETGVYADFSMIQAHVFGPFLPFPRHDPPLSALSERGYYFGVGGTGESRLRVERGLVRLDAGLRAHAVRALDGWDRTELVAGAPEDPHGVTDQRLFGRVGLSARLGVWPLRLAVVGEGALRRGAWRSQSRTTTDASVAAELVIEP